MADIFVPVIPVWKQSLLVSLMVCVASHTAEAMTTEKDVLLITRKRDNLTQVLPSTCSNNSTSVDIFRQGDILKCDFDNETTIKTSSDSSTSAYVKYAKYEVPLYFTIATSAISVTNYVTPPLSVVTNGLSILIFVRLRKAKQQILMALIALTIADYLSMLQVYDTFVASISGFRLSKFVVACQAIYWISVASQMCSSYYVLLFTLERFISVRFPLKRATIWTKQRTLFTIVAIPVTCLMAQSYQLYFYTAYWVGNLPDHKEISKKWENLRRSHRRHFNAKKKIKRSGSAADDEVDPTNYDDDEDCDDGLWESMSFLQPYMKVKETCSNLVTNDEPMEAYEDMQPVTNSTMLADGERELLNVNDCDAGDGESVNEEEQSSANKSAEGNSVRFESTGSEGAQAPSPVIEVSLACGKKFKSAKDNSSCNVKSKKSKSAVLREEDNALRMISHAIREQGKKPALVSESGGDEFDAYGRYVAHELRNIKEAYTRDVVKHEFSQTLFRAKWGSLERDGETATRPIQQNPISSASRLSGISYPWGANKTRTIENQSYGSDIHQQKSAASSSNEKYFQANNLYDDGGYSNPQLMNTTSEAGQNVQFPITAPVVSNLQRQGWKEAGYCAPLSQGIWSDSPIPDDKQPMWSGMGNYMTGDLSISDSAVASLPMDPIGYHPFETMMTYTSL